MSTFDNAKEKAGEFMEQAKEKFGRQQDGDQQGGQEREGMSGKVDELRDKASDAMQNVKDRFNG
jgi:ElaB/YqjD/DUF883 family membrane-anchored ribosome-binding protein